MVRRMFRSEGNEKYMQKFIWTCIGHEDVNGNKTAQYNIQH
jgi:hypothetical protein